MSSAQFSTSSCFPRIRGDVPPNDTIKLLCYEFSPHTRGCSAAAEQRIVDDVVFPAYAGMFLRLRPFFIVLAGFPRIRGDVPGKKSRAAPTALFSPHTRGCSFPSGPYHAGLLVFPAYAGMFPAASVAFAPARRFPRIRGDVPAAIGFYLVMRRFSPHTRGCSAEDDTPKSFDTVFPAYAGMFR